jgi:hypothetical protein
VKEPYEIIKSSFALSRNGYLIVLSAEREASTRISVLSTFTFLNATLVVITLI